MLINDLPAATASVGRKTKTTEKKTLKFKERYLCAFYHKRQVYVKISVDGALN